MTLISTLLLLSLGVGSDGTAKVEFGRDVQPILSKRCFVCHGPDEGTREARMRLDLPEIVGEERGVLVPGRPDESELISRITSEYEDEVMPPPEEGEALTKEEIGILRRWVEEGAEYERHWSFQPILLPAPPSAQGEAWGCNEIDAFVLARLEEAGLEPSAEAERATLIRRLSFDLCGMPPTPEAVAAFVRDDGPRAYEELVDRLFASVAYAERMTLAWMDAARYGDTSVHHADGPRDMWAWRDWVIEAYAGNMPFDQFTIEQLAGDLLEDPTNAQLVASGFHRNTPTSDEGGAIDEELRVKYMVDRVKTTSNVWLGLSMECGQCHDHKYDPISQKDYYRFYAYFNQSVEKGFQTRSGNAEPLVRVSRGEEAAEIGQLEESIREVEAFFDDVHPPEAELLAWCEAERERVLAVELPELGSWYSLGPFQKKNKAAAYATDHGPEAVAIDVGEELGGLTWRERAGDGDGVIHNLGLPDNAAIYLTRAIHSERKQSVEISLGSDDSVRVWLDSELVFEHDIGRGTAVDQDRAVLELPAGQSRLLLKIVNGAGASGYYFKLLGIDLPETVLAALELEPEAWGDGELALLEDHYQRTSWPEGVEQAAVREAAVARKAEIESGLTTVMVMKDLAKRRMTYVLDRGNYDAPRKDEPVEPGILEDVFALPEGAQANRLGLAQWLVDEDHPMTARVAVNRYWAMLFGRGLVATVMDFGSQGDRPSHPQLLDWLARDFVESGWDVKRTLKQLVMSATYRQSSRIVPGGRERDPENVLLGRAPRYRLYGEFLRDQALAVSGLLVDQVGGPGVKPYQPPGLWNAVALARDLRFKQDHGDKLYRKSMYIYWKRSAPQPSMSTFDTPIRDTCVIQRQRTNTPLQALVTLNDVQFVEAARQLAQRLIVERGSFEERLDLGFLLCTARPADALRRDVMRLTYLDQLTAFRADPDAAGKLLSAGESPRDETLDPAEHASWTVLCSMILNLDETLTRE